MAADQFASSTGWHLHHHATQSQTGPHTFYELVRLARDRRLFPDDLVWCPGWEGWRRADSVPQLLAPVPPIMEATAAPIAHVAGAIGVVGGVLTVCDFLEKVGPFTTAAIIVSAAGLTLIFLLRRSRILSPTHWTNASLALLLMLVGSAGVKVAQTFIPGANERGVVAQVIPGAGQLQNAMLSSLSRIEQQTKRTTEILEDNAHRAEKARDAEARAQSEQAAEIQTRIAEGGYSVDEAGYLAAAKDNFRYIADFNALGIKLTEAGLRDFLAKFERQKNNTITYSEALERFGSFLAEQRDASPAVRKVVAAIGSDGKKMGAAFKSKGARAAVCDAASYGLPVAVEGLAAACKLDGAAFAEAYVFYFNGTYGKLMMETFVDRNAFLAPSDYVGNDVGELQLRKVTGPLVLSQLAGCAHYEGELTFEVDDYSTDVAGGVGGNTAAGDYFTLTDEAARNGGIQSLCSGATTYGTPFCRGHVVVARDCTPNPSSTIVRVLSLDRPVSKIFGVQVSR